MSDLIKVFNRGTVTVPSYTFKKITDNQWVVRKLYDGSYGGTFYTRREAIRRCYELQQAHINKMLKQLREEY